jgi:hypothetical protein
MAIVQPIVAARPERTFHPHGPPGRYGWKADLRLLANGANCKKKPDRLVTW